MTDDINELFKNSRKQSQKFVKAMDKFDGTMEMKHIMIHPYDLALAKQLAQRNSDVAAKEVRKAFKVVA